jgi:hypothetical protein
MSLIAYGAQDTILTVSRDREILLIPMPMPMPMQTRTHTRTNTRTQTLNSFPHSNIRTLTQHNPNISIKQGS